ncbi:prostaglandin E2 receptor EP4 subtype-like [Ostrea edulis]|uniref:prostaglandin E2 receptor EP4 subtype-like n=1 Tax=Ostrea edulis TaxID=37623 RepID=UPI0024AF7E7F|nr:prostaglandin E2 receptor EP4 subtype-like [Ostrea edulis]XP_048758799.2 prostaglandin E2 receptor EP4 subtype-like [Ostrea edulis]XP_048758800.2 prostaglandin E2 receptor EP4 subtype-like [Ostrea edulis]XP_056020261.1 prostaglandin E2 receptor EP4 subtype-like [Ostrea edulis]
MAASFCYSTDLTNLTIKLSKTVSPLDSSVSFTLGVIGNILALAMLIKHADQHKWKIFYRLVGALAFTDLFGILTTSPVVFAVYNNKFMWVGGQPLCDYFSFMLIFASLGTLTTVTAMSLDRFLALWYPYFYNSSQKKRRVHAMLVGIWIFAAVVASMPLMKFGHNIRHFPCTWCFIDYFGTSQTDRIFSILYASLGILTVVCSSTFNCLVIFAVSRGGYSTHRGSVKSVRGKQREKRNEIFVLVFLIAVLLMHSVCWMPFMIRVLINTSGARPNFKADLLVLRMASWNQILDPWLYIVLRKEMLIRIYNFYRKKRYGVASVTPNHSTESSSGSLHSSQRLQTLSPIQKKLLKKMNSTDSNTSNINEDRHGSSGRINSPSLLRKT